MPIPSTGEIKLNDDVNATLQADTNEQDVSLGDNNTVKFTAVDQGTTVSGRSMSELRGQSLFQIFPSTADTGALGESLHMDGLSSSHNSVKVLEPASTTAPAFTNTRGTFSFWVKIHETESGKRYLYTSGTADGSLVSMRLHSSGSDHKFQVRIDNVYHTSEAIFVDKAGWYNFVISLDSSIIGDVSKVKAYANGIPLNWSSIGNLTDNQAFQFGTNQRINDWAFGDGYGADATYANFIFVDGSALLPNEFGELSQGIWVPKGVNTPSSQSLVITNLVADYQFQGNANDTSVGGTTYNGTPSNVTFQQNNYNIASFNGSSSYIDTNANFTPDLMSFSAWVNPTNGSSYRTIFSNRDGNSSNYKGIDFGITDSGNIYSRFDNGGSRGSSNSNNISLPLNTWTHLAFTINMSSSIQKVYKNGVFVYQETTSGSLVTNNDFYIGRYFAAANAYWQGKIGEIQLYSTEITDANVLQNYNATKYKYFYGLNGWHLNLNNSDQGSIVLGSDLKLHLDAGDWDADGTDETSFSGTAWNDKSGNGYNAALTHSPAYNANNGGYFTLDGSNDYITVPHNTAFNLDVDTTIEIWAYRAATTNEQTLIFKGNSSSNQWFINWNNSSGHYFYDYDTGSLTKSGTDTTPINEWYHFVLAWNATDKKAKMYINGREPNYNTVPTAGSGTVGTSNTSNLEIGRSNSVTGQPKWNGSIAQVRVYSKTLTAQEAIQNFRATQGHYEVLSLADISGNVKGAIANGTNLDGSDHTGDKPDVSYATLSSLAKSSYITLSNGGTALTHSQSSWRAGNGTIGVNSGKWYYEVKMTAANTSGATANNAYFAAGWEDASLAGKYETSPFSTPYNRVIAVFDSGAFGVVTSGTSPNYGTSNINSSSQFAVNDVLGIALDADTGSVQIYKNGSALGSAVTLTADAYMVYYAKWSSTHGNGIFNFGAKGFAYTPPSGYKALSSDNLPTATGVDPVNQKKPRDYFETVLYTGNNAFQKIGGLEFDPDFVWIKNRGAGGYHHDLYDTVRGDNLRMFSSQTSSETTGYLQFTTNGFNLTSGGGANTLSEDHVAWCWKAGGKAVSNTAGTGITSSVSASSTGFSIVKWTTTTTGTHTVGHGLNVNGVATKPGLMILKNISNGSTNWFVYTDLIDGSMDFLYLNGSSNKADSSLSVPTTTTFQQGNLGGVSAGNTGLAYLFASVPGFQKIGTYSGNGNSNGPFIYTGFKPAWVIIKSASTGNSGDWMIVDNARNTENTRNARIDANTNDGEATDAIMDFHSNGFKLITSSAAKNRDGYKFIYLAIAEDPAKYAQGTGVESDTEKFLEKGAGETSYPEDNFKTVHWTGNGGLQNIDDVGFKPGFVWTQARSFGNYPQAFDSIRGVTKEIEPATTSGEATNADSLTSFTNNGFILGSSNNVNQNTSTYKAWCWKAGDTTVTKKPTYTSAGILTSNLALHYNFADSNTYAGTGTDLTNIATSSTVSNALQNSPTFVDRSYGNYFDLDGTNDYIRTDWQQNSSTTMTFETWQWVDNDSSYRYIWGDFNTAGANTSGRFGTRIYNDNQVTVFIGNGTNDSAFTSGILDYTPYLEKWTHFVWTINGTTGKLYINGILMSVKTFTNSIAANGTNNMALGNYTGGAITTQTFDGKFGQARIYTAELTQAQIRANYDATRTLYQGVGTTANVLQTGLLNNIDVDSYSSYDPNSFGTTNQVAVFDGNNSRITLPAISAIPTNSSPNKSYSVSFWINSTTTRLNAPSGTYRSGQIFGFFDDTYSMIGFGGDSSSSFPAGKFFYYNYGGSGQRNNWIITSDSYADGNWHHVVVTDEYVSSGNTRNRKLYVDSTLQASDSQSNTWYPSSSGNTIGSHNTNNQLDADVDQVRIFDKTLSDAEVKVLYNETSSTTSTLQVLGDSSCVAGFNLNSNSNNLTGSNNGADNNITYKFDNTTGYRIKDQTSNNLSLGSLVNTTINKANSWGTSLKYDGTGDYVTLPVGLGRTASQDVTRELWVKIDDYPASGSTDNLLYIGDMSANQYYENLRVTNTGTVDYQERPTNSGGGSDFILSTDSSNILVEGVWHHVAYTSQGRIKKIYINGKLVASKKASSDRPNNSTYGGSLGSFRGSHVATFQGEIAQFRSYTSALTDAQIKANFDATKAQFYSALIHSLVSVNDKAGFSVVKYIGEGNETDVVSHGQSAPPDFIMTKRYDASGQSWNMRTPNSKNPANSLTFPIGSNNKVLSFNGTHGYADYTMDAQTNTAGGEYISYCFRNIPGYMKIGEYIGNMSTDGPRVYTGFRPRFIATKSTDAAGSSWLRWYIKDLASDIDETVLYPNYLYATPSYDNVDVFTDGFKIKANDDTAINGNGVVFFYWAIA